MWQTDVTGLMGRALQEGSEGGNELRVAGPHPEASSLLLFSFYRLLYLLLGMKCQVPRQTWVFLFFLYRMSFAININALPRELLEKSCSVGVGDKLSICSLEGQCILDHEN